MCNGAILDEIGTSMIASSANMGIELELIACTHDPMVYTNTSLVPRPIEKRYLLFAHARVAVEFHRRRLSSYTFAVRDEYSSVFLAVREALLFAIYSDDCIVSSFLEALAQ